MYHLFQSRYINLRDLNSKDDSSDKTQQNVREKIQLFFFLTNKFPYVRKRNGLQKQENYLFRKLESTALQSIQFYVKIGWK